MGERNVGDDFVVVFGVSLVLLGALLTLTQLLGIRVIQVGWPLLVLVPGLAITAAAFAGPQGRGLGYLAVPGAIIIVVGVILEVQAFTGDWQSWSYAWPLVAPGGVGLDEQDGADGSHAGGPCNPRSRPGVTEPSRFS